MVENNLDVLINKISYDIAKEANKEGLQNYVEKLLGILINDGVYAYFVYCKAQGKQNSKNEKNEDNKQNKEKTNKVEKVFVEKVIKYGENNNLIDVLGLNNKEDNERFFEELPQNLDELFLFRSVLERILTYARYHLKAMENNGGKSA